MRAFGLITGWDGSGFGIIMQNIRVRSTLTGSVSVHSEDGRKDRLAATSRRTELDFKGIVDDGNIPEAGETLTYLGKTYLITSAVLTSEKGKIQRFDMKAECSDEAEVSGL